MRRPRASPCLIPTRLGRGSPVITSIRTWILIVWGHGSGTGRHNLGDPSYMRTSRALCRTWWRHQMEIFSALLALCAGNSSVPGEFPTQRPVSVTRSFDVFFDLRLNKRLTKQWWCRWFETPSRPLWRQCNDITFLYQSYTFLFILKYISPRLRFVLMSNFLPWTWQIFLEGSEKFLSLTSPPVGIYATAWMDSWRVTLCVIRYYYVRWY